jgi:putative addiction module killer protein
MLPMSMPEVRFYVAPEGDQPFAAWFGALDSVARARVTRAIARLEQGNFSNVKSVGEGVLEYRIDFGPGYRVYFRRDAKHL